VRDAEAACAEHAPGWADLADLHFSLAIAAAELDEAVEQHTGWPRFAIAPASAG